MNHHIPPLILGSNGERRVLSSCRSKGKKVCKYDFPLDAAIQGRAIDVLRGIQENSSVADGVCAAAVYEEHDYNLLTHS